MPGRSLFRRVGPLSFLAGTAQWLAQGRCLFVGWVLILAPLETKSWGPHPAITQAALDVLGTNHGLFQILGPYAQRLTNYCWLADFKRLPFRDGEQDFYADDYLLFPEVSLHLDHICPEVKRTHAPYFRRALQALRGESPANAARWIGSLLHFTEDTGSPPHAAEIRGGTHSKMENWVDATQIRIAGYRPRLLGEDEASALDGFLRRMDELIAFSKPRGQKLITPVLFGQRKAVEPVALECALETGRVVADLLWTLGELAARSRVTGARWTGVVQSTNAPKFERVPARICLLGTSISTLADAQGRFELRSLPPARYAAVVSRPGSASSHLEMEVVAGTNTHQVIVLAPGGLVRNNDFKTQWLKPGAPDHWFETGQGWEGEIIALEIGRKYRLKVVFRPGTKGEVLLRWSRHLEYELPQNVKLPRIEARPLRPENPDLEFTASETMALMQLTVRGGRPTDVCSRIDLVPE
jgi:hypothetical protein